MILVLLKNLFLLFLTTHLHIFWIRNRFLCSNLRDWTILVFCLIKILSITNILSEISCSITKIRSTNWTLTHRPIQEISSLSLWFTISRFIHFFLVISNLLILMNVLFRRIPVNWKVCKWIFIIVFIFIFWKLFLAIIFRVSISTILFGHLFIFFIFKYIIFFKNQVLIFIWFRNLTDFTILLLSGKH